MTHVQVMHPNGVSHLEVGNDQEGVDRILQWLSYVPKTAGSLPAARPVTDPVDREVCKGYVRGDGRPVQRRTIRRILSQKVERGTPTDGWGKKGVDGGLHRRLLRAGSAARLTYEQNKNSNGGGGWGCGGVGGNAQSRCAALLHAEEQVAHQRHRWG